MGEATFPVPEIDAPAEVASTGGVGSDVRKASARKEAAAAKAAAAAAAKAASGVPSVADVQKQIARLEAEREKLTDAFFGGHTWRRGVDALAEATARGKRAEHIEQAASAAYRLGHLAGALHALSELRRLAAAAEMRQQAQLLRDAAGRAQDAAAALKVDAALTRKLGHVLSERLNTEAQALERRAHQEDCTCKVDVARFNPENRETWPATAVVVSRETQTARLQALARAQETA